MSIIDRFLRLFMPKIHRTHRRRDLAGSSFTIEEVKRTSLSEKVAKEQSISMVKLLLAIHRDLNFSICKVDDDLLQLIDSMLELQKGEERSVVEIKFNLYKKYAEELHDRILEYIDWHEETYINFKGTSEILNRAERIMANTQLDTENLIGIIKEMSTELNKLTDKEEGNEVDGFRAFGLRFLSILVTETVTIFGVVYAVGNKAELITSTLIYLYLVGFPTWYIYRYLHKRYFIVGKKKIFEKHDYI